MSGVAYTLFRSGAPRAVLAEHGVVPAWRSVGTSMTLVLDVVPWVFSMGAEGRQSMDTGGRGDAGCHGILLVPTLFHAVPPPSVTVAPS